MKRILIILFFLPVSLLAQLKPDGSGVVPASNVLPVPSDYNVNTKVNYVRVWDAIVPLKTEVDVLSSSRTIHEVKQATQYFDGLGRPLQTVIKQSSPSLRDLVTPVFYDAFGRESVQYLPYIQISGNTNDGRFKANAFAAQNSFYASYMSSQGNAGEQVFYSQTELESSPLNRPLKAYPPGNSWGGSNRGVSMKYEFNTSEDEVRVWKIDNAIGAIATTAGVYSANELYKTTTVDEQGKQTVEYKDREGKVILKKVQIDNIPSSAYAGWLCTYYVYDDLSQLRFVMQPKLVEYLVSNAWPTILQVQVDELCFRYEYDYRGRMVIKKVPGAAEVHMVYDDRDRLVMMQDGNMRGKGQWVVTKYDAINRQVQTILWNNTQTRDIHQASINGSNSYPNTSGGVVLTETYYDSYQWASGVPGLSTSITNTWTSNLYPINTSPLYAEQPGQTNLTKGMLTGTRVRVLTTGEYLYTVTFYDSKGRVSQIRSTNIDNGFDILTNQYDFSGKTLLTHQLHYNASNGNNTEVVTRLEYDNMGRVLKLTKQINGGQQVVTVQNEYNELGQLKTKKLGQQRDDNTNYTNNPLETLDYAYNIRGWLTGINKDYTLSQGSNAHYFGMTLNYDNGFTNKFYNGNISGTIWKSRGAGKQRAYGFDYDKANRLLKADFTESTDAQNYNTSVVDFSMRMGDGVNHTSAYDANGNIKAMWQMGFNLTGSQVIDDLTYNFYANSNKLKEVIDPVAKTGLGDFTDNASDLTGRPIDYYYDDNGNLVNDRNKGIETITYNYLNLPETITITGKGTIQYTYDAAGTKLRKTVIDNTNGTQATTVTTYIGGFIYEQKDNAPQHLQFILHEEGRIRPNASQAGGFAYDYFIKDHLGNVRTTLTDEYNKRRYIATLEEPRLLLESSLFTELSSADKPILFDAATENERVEKVNSTSAQTVIGAGLLLKVMAGDKINASVFAKYNKYENNVNPDDQKAIAGQITQAMSNAFGRQYSRHSDVASELAASSWLDGVMSFLQTKVDQGANNDGSKAHINWIMLDEEQLKLVQENSGFKRVPQMDITDEKELVQAEDGEDIEIQRNGYIYVYVSNSANIPMFFDDLRVEHKPGPLVEETHYYPFGLVMSGITSKAMNGVPENKKKFNDGTERTTDVDLNWDETDFRSYDAQIGRFIQIDPLSFLTDDVSPYAFALNNPILLNDPLGLFADSTKAPGFPNSIGGAEKHLGDVTVTSTKSNYSKFSSFQTGLRNGSFSGFGLNNKYSQIGIPLPIPLPPIFPPSENKLRRFDEAGPLGINWLKIVDDISVMIKEVVVDIVVSTVALLASTISMLLPSEKTADELLPGSLKRSPSYNPKYGDKTRSELESLAKQGDKVAAKMKKLIDQIPRLLDKNKNK